MTVTKLPKLDILFHPIFFIKKVADHFIIIKIFEKYLLIFLAEQGSRISNVTNIKHSSMDKGNHRCCASSYLFFKVL